jgi:hypothetical protein
MATRGIDFEQFSALIAELVQEDALGQPPDTNDSEEVTLVYTWSVLMLLRLDQEYASYEDFTRERAQYHKTTDPVMRSIWLLLTPHQRSVFGAFVNLSHVLQRGAPSRKRGRDDDGDNGDLAIVKYQTGPGRERREALEKVQFMMEEMLPEIRTEIVKEMALRPMMKFLVTSKASMELVTRVFPLFVQRDIMANLDYESFDDAAAVVNLRKLMKAFMAKFAPDGRRFWHQRGLTVEEREWFTAEASLVGFPLNDADTFEIYKDVFIDLLVLGVPRDVTPFQLYREVMEYVARQMWSEYASAIHKAQVIGRRGCVWIAFSTPVHGHIFDVRFAPIDRTNYNDPFSFGTRELRVLSGDPEIERLIAPLRDFYRARDRIFPRVVQRVVYDSDEDEEEVSLVRDKADEEEEARVFQDSMLNLLYGLSPLLTMMVEEQAKNKSVETWYLALDTNAHKQTPEKYAKRSTALAAAAQASQSSRTLTLKGNMAQTSLGHLFTGWKL